MPIISRPSRNPRWFVALLVALAWCACSSSPDDATPVDVDSGTAKEAAANPDAADTSLDAHADAAPDVISERSSTVVDAAADRSEGDAEASSPREPDASGDCVKYCDCMAQNCQDKVFADGCLPACASQTKWDLPCRMNMCSLVPAQPNNDHCTHAFGVNECLDTP